ncbi:MAG: PadR family transcriptional regulator [Gemmatimonadaceae bacterium]
MPGDSLDVLHGTLDLLVLKALAVGPLHGWAISKRIRELSREVLEVNQGSLYPALYRLENRGWITGEEALSNEGRRLRIYRSTAAGRKQLAREIQVWKAYAGAMQHVIAAG